MNNLKGLRVDLVWFGLNEKGFGDETSFKEGRLVTPQNSSLNILFGHFIRLA
ncbi:hypothetical protein HanRHA438_Chr02g0064491 [Helianthus annuus]|nr:hypothetical protein HanRHA438_Chr02g0064491 [Helianthus annuus]